MNPPRVLIADDEIPYGDNRDLQTREAFRQTRPDASDEDYREGYDGMQGACSALRSAEFELTVCRRFKEAEDAIRNATAPFEVAIIDLGWAAEPSLDDRDNAGKNLVKTLRQTGPGRLTRVIMYSSRFNKDEALAESACRLGTLPLVKTYTKASHQTLVAAVRFLALSKPTPDEQVFSSAMSMWQERHAELRSLYMWCRILMVGVATVMIAAAVVLLFGKTSSGTVGFVGSVLVTVLLGYVSQQLRHRVKDVREAMDAALEHAREMRHSSEAA